MDRRGRIRAAAAAAVASASLVACTSSAADAPARTTGTSTTTTATTTLSGTAAVAPSPSTASTEPAQVVTSPGPPTDDGCRLRPDGSPDLEITVWGDRSPVCAGGSGPSSLPVVDLAGVAVGSDLPDLRGFVQTDGATAVCVGTGARSTMAEAANACAPGTSFRLLQIVGRHLHAGPETVTTLPYLAVAASAFRVARVGTVDEQWCVAEADESAAIPGASVFACDIPDSADVDALTVTLVDAAGEEQVVGPGDGVDDPVPVRPVRVTFDGGCPARVPATPGIDQVSALAANPAGLPDGAGGFVPVTDGPALLCRFSQVSRPLLADDDGDADGPGTVWIDGLRRPAVGGDLAIATTIDAAAASALADAVRAIPFDPQVTHSCGGMHADVYTVIAFRVDGGARDVDLWVDGPGICSSIGTGAADQLDGSPEFGEFQTQLEALLG